MLSPYAFAVLRHIPKHLLQLYVYSHCHYLYYFHHDILLACRVRKMLLFTAVASGQDGWVLAQPLFHGSLDFGLWTGLYGLKFGLKFVLMLSFTLITYFFLMGTIAFARTEVLLSSTYFAIGINIVQMLATCQLTNDLVTRVQKSTLNIKIALLHVLMFSTL